MADQVAGDETDFLALLSRAFKERGVRAVMVGGFCLPVYGVERMTLDIDFMIAESQREDAGKAVESAGWRRVFRNPLVDKYRSQAPARPDVDLLPCRDQSLATMYETGDDHAFAGASFRCASLDMILATKLHAIRYNEVNREGRDFDDLCKLLRANGISVASERFSRLCEKYGTEDILKRLKAIEDA